MRTLKLFSSLLFFLFAVLSLNAQNRINSNANGVSVSFHQINWLAGEDGKGRNPINNSFVGEAFFSFSRPAANMMVGKIAYINILTRINGKQEWSVQNLPVQFPSLNRMLTSKLATHFNLGVRNGQAIRSISYSLSVTANPLAAAPAGNMAQAQVKAINFKAGGRNGRFVPFPNDLPKAFVGVRAPAGGGPLAGIKIGTTKVGGKGIAKIVEDPMGCVPSSLARSIHYLKPNGLTTTPQQTYEDLKEPLGWTEAGGVPPGDIVKGKNAFTKANNLPITTTAWATPKTNSDPSTKGIRISRRMNWTQFFDGLVSELNKGADIEILIRSVRDPLMFHLAMITSVTVLPSGKAIVTIVENDSQGTPGTETNKEKTLVFDPSLGRFSGTYNYDIMLAIIEK
ncbi:MAG: hypothetical protein AAFY71_28530 [Bacteroidota bacterium]